MIYVAIGIAAVCSFLAGVFLQRSWSSEAANLRRVKLDDAEDELEEEFERRRLETLRELRRKQELEWNEKVREMLK